MTRTAAQHCKERIGKEKLYFSLLTSVKCQKAPLGGSVSTDFVTDCTVTSLKWLIFHFLTNKMKRQLQDFKKWFWPWWNANWSDKINSRFWTRGRWLLSPFKEIGKKDQLIIGYYIILLHENFLQFDWLRAVIFQLNLKYQHVKITNLLWVVV